MKNTGLTIVLGGSGAQFGIGGMMVAVPLATVIRILVREYCGLSRWAADIHQRKGDEEKTAPANKPSV